MKNIIFPIGLAFAFMFSACGGNAPAENQTQGNTVAADTTTKTPPTTQPAPEEEKGYKVGDIAMDFQLKNVDGKMVSMADMKNAKGFVVIFTCNHCPFSIAYEDRIIALDKKYKSKGYPVIAINPNDAAIAPDDSFEGMVTRAKEKGFTFPYLHDEAQTVFPKYGATKTPHCYILQKAENQLKVVYVGAFDDAKEPENVKEKYVEMAIEALLAGNAPNPSSTKAFGCSIKYDKAKIQF